jgi:hypothetical protein
MPLVLLNLLIAIMSATFERVSESDEIEDTKERLNWILEIAKFFKFMKRKKEYMHIHKVTALTGTEKENSVEEQILRMKHNFKKGLELMSTEVEKMTKSSQRAKANVFDQKKYVYEVEHHLNSI